MTELRLYTFLARCQAWTASPMCKDPATALRVPINRGNEVPRKVARGARGRKEGRQVVGQR